MGNSLDILMDDRPLIQIGRHIMRRRSNHLYATSVSLMIRLCTLETWKERMVDIDTTTRKKGCQIVRKYLHVTRQNYEFGLGFRDELLDPGFLLPQRLIDRLAADPPADRHGLEVVEGMRRWRVDVCGDEILGALAAPGGR